MKRDYCERCEHCKFWSQFSSEGLCRRMPPVVDGSTRGQWPITMLHDWCGEFREHKK